MTLATLDLISAHPWQRVTFTTYALSLSFFEAVILSALIRAGGREAMILADIAGVRASLSEQGAQRVGKDYEVEPVSVSSGCRRLLPLPRKAALLGRRRNSPNFRVSKHGQSGRCGKVSQNV